LFLTALVPALGVCLWWGFSKSFGPLVGFSVLFGLTAGGYDVTWNRFALDILFDDMDSQSTIMGIYLFGRYVVLHVSFFLYLKLTFIIGE